VTKYLTSLRIHKSCQMLNSGNYSISEIASATGFNDYFYFLKTFKKITGVTPRQYQLGEGTDLNLFSGNIPV
jgi:two-component system response regulator YesN